MARVPLPPVPKKDVCPTCKRPIFSGVFGSCMSDSLHHIGYTRGLIGKAVDPLEIKGPRIGTDEEAT